MPTVSGVTICLPLAGELHRSAGGPSGRQSILQLLMALVSGQADRLTGRHISHEDSIDDLLRRTDDIVQQDLYTLRLRV